MNLGTDFIFSLFAIADSQTDVSVIVAVLAVLLGGLFWWLVKWGKHDRNFARKDEHPLDRQLVEASDFEKLEKKVDCIQRDMDKRFSEMAVNSSMSRDKIYNSIRELEKTNASQTTELKLVNQTLSRFDGKLDRLFEKKADKG